MAYTTIDNPTSFFETLTWTGDGTSPRTLSGLQFQPDWVWGKRRDDAAGHNLFDSVRTAGSDKNLQSNGNGAEGSGSPGTYGYLSAFTSDGFTVTAGSSDNAYWNNNTATYVSWNWLAGGSTSSNGDGSITSTVSVNSTSGFSIVSYVGGGASSATVGHGLGATPAMIIVKNRSITEEWRVWHQNLSGSTYKVSLNSSGAQDSSATVFNGQSSTTFTVGNDPSVSGSGNNIIAYCFKEVKGYSKFGGYTGNGSTSGPFVYTGFKPAFVLMKRTDGSNSWNIFDNKRAIDNPVQHRLFPDTSDAEATSTGNAVDFLSNGFVGRSSGSTVNHDGGTYIYMAFAEAPFVTEGTKAAGTAR
jgi:hypothetical protein